MPRSIASVMKEAKRKDHLREEVIFNLASVHLDRDVQASQKIPAPALKIICNSTDISF